MRRGVAITHEPSTVARIRTHRIVPQVGGRSRPRLVERQVADETNALELLKSVGFTDELLNAPVASLSGGWRMKLSLVVAALMDADILLARRADEPPRQEVNRMVSSYLTTTRGVLHDRQSRHGLFRCGLHGHYSLRIQKSSEVSREPVGICGQVPGGCAAYIGSRNRLLAMPSRRRADWKGLTATTKGHPETGRRYLHVARSGPAYFGRCVL